MDKPDFSDFQRPNPIQRIVGFVCSFICISAVIMYGFESISGDELQTILLSWGLGGYFIYWLLGRLPAFLSKTFDLTFSTAGSLIGWLFTSSVSTADNTYQHTKKLVLTTVIKKILIFISLPLGVAIFHNYIKPLPIGELITMPLTVIAAAFISRSLYKKEYKTFSIIGVGIGFLLMLFITGAMQIPLWNNFISLYGVVLTGAWAGGHYLPIIFNKLKRYKAGQKLISIHFSWQQIAGLTLILITAFYAVVWYLAKKCAAIVPEKGLHPSYCTIENFNIMLGNSWFQIPMYYLDKNKWLYAVFFVIGTVLFFYGMKSHKATTDHQESYSSENDHKEEEPFEFDDDEFSQDTSESSTSDDLDPFGDWRFDSKRDKNKYQSQVMKSADPAAAPSERRMAMKWVEKVNKNGTRGIKPLPQK